MVAPIGGDAAQGFDLTLAGLGGGSGLIVELGEVKPKVLREAMDKYQIHDVSAADAGNTEGSG